VLRDVDSALQTLFRTRVTTLAAGSPPTVLPAQVGVAPPDDDWINDVDAGTPRKAINIFLAELRENRELRSPARVQRRQGAVVLSEPAPMRVAAHYLITAWSPSQDRRTRTLDEHDVLAEAANVLADVQVVTVGGVDLPTEIMPPEGFPKLAEFWGTMGSRHRWKPAIQLIVTVPLLRSPDVSGTPVTTRTTDYLIAGAPETAIRRIQIAGIVTDAAGTPVRRAWVQLEQAGVALSATRTNTRGEFDFMRVEPGSYRFRARADGLAEVLTPTTLVPSQSGRYDIVFP
jgi:hypothetical protein